MPINEHAYTYNEAIDKCLEIISDMYEYKAGIVIYPQEIYEKVSELKLPPELESLYGYDVR